MSAGVVRKKRKYSIADLTDVDEHTNPPTAGNVLAFSSSSGLWSPSLATVPTGGTGTLSFATYGVLLSGPSSSSALTTAASGSGMSSVLCTAATGPPSFQTIQATAPLAVGTGGTSSVVLSQSGTLPVSLGGTGASSFAGTNSLLLGNATSAAKTVATTGANGDVLVGNVGGGGGPPAFQTVQGSAPLSVDASSGTSIVLAVEAPLKTAHGGTGLSAAPAAGSLLCSGDAVQLRSVAPGAAGTVVVGHQASALPTYQAVAGAAPVNVNASLQVQLTATVGVAGGGTGVSQFDNAQGVVCAGTSSTAPLQVTATGAEGQVLVSTAGGAVPSFQTVAADAPFSVDHTGNKVTLALSGTTPLALGGTGTNSFAPNELLTAGASALVPLAPGADGSALVSGANASAAPSFQAFAGSGVVTVNCTGASVQIGMNTMDVPSGGTGLSSQTASNQLVCAGASSQGALQPITSGAQGTVLVSRGSSFSPAFVAFAGSDGFGVTSSGGNIGVGLGIIPMTSGGTGTSSFSQAYSPVLAGATSLGSLGTAAAGTVLVSGAGGGSAAPAYQQMTGSGAVGVTSSGTTVGVGLVTPIGVDKGGTGVTSVGTASLLCVGAGSQAALTTVGSTVAGRVLVSQASTAPSFQTIQGTAPLTLTSAGSDIALSLASTFSVGAGGTGVTSMTTPYALVAGGTGTTTSMQICATKAAGQILCSKGTASLPAFQAMTYSSPMSASSPGGAAVALSMVTPLGYAAGGSGTGSFLQLNQPLVSAATQFTTVLGTTQSNYTLASQGATNPAAYVANPLLGSSAVYLNFYSESGTFTYTRTLHGASSVIVQLVGGGGGGGGAGSSTSRAAGGGGAGGYAMGYFTAAQVGTGQTVTVGAAGTAGNDATGGNGGGSSFGALMTTGGGTGGTRNGGGTLAVYSGGAGGTAGTGGLLNAIGQYGKFGFAHNANGALVSWGGRGGHSVFGSGGASPGRTTSGATAGNPGLGWGSGGSGGSSMGSSSSGGPGASGCCIITEIV